MGRVAFGFGMGAALLLGCGLSLVVDEVPGETPPGPIVDAATDTQRPTADTSIPETSTPDTSAPPDAAVVVYDLREELPVPIPGVVALAFDPTGALIALAHDGVAIAAHDVAKSTVVFTSAERSAPSSLVALGSPRPGMPIGLYASSARPGLYGFIASERVSRPYGARGDAVRVNGRLGKVFATVPGDAGPPQIVACMAPFPDSEPDCDSPTKVFDGDLGGFAVSANGLVLAGVMGTGTGAKLALSSRAATTATFAAPVAVTLAPSVTVKVDEVVDVSDNARRIRVRGPCKATAGPTCLFTLGP